MKKTLLTLTLAAIAAMASNTGKVEAQAATPVVDMQKVADAYAGTPVTYWRGGYSFNGTTNGYTTSVSSTFVIQMVGGHWGFTEMNINGQELPIDGAHPMWTLPPYLAGDVTSFSMNLYGYDNDGNMVRNGNFYTSKLAPNANINVTIFLSYKTAHIDYQPQAGMPASRLGISSPDGRYNGSYDPYSGQFIVSYDPLNPPSAWLIIDQSNGSVIGTLPFNGGSPGSQPNSGYGLSMVNQYGLPEMYLNNTNGSYSGLNGLQSDYSISNDGTNSLGKIVDIHVTSPSDYLMVFLGNIRPDSLIQAYGLNRDTGEMEHIGDWSPASGMSYVNISNVTGYADYKFVLIGQPTDPVNGFNISAFDSTYTFIFTGGGKG